MDGRPGDAPPRRGDDGSEEVALHSQESDDSQQESQDPVGGGATAGHLGAAAFKMDPKPARVTLGADTHDRELTSDPLEVSSNVDAFSPVGGRSLPVASPSRNTFESGRSWGAAGQPTPDAELQSRRPGIVDYFSSRKQPPPTGISVAGWKLFGKVPPKQSPSRHARVVQQDYEARQVAARCSPTHHAVGQQSRKKVDLEPSSTTALILENRPPNLPAKSAVETQRHRREYEEMVAAAKRRELRDAQRRQQQDEQRRRQEEGVSSAALVWDQIILPQWDAMKWSYCTRDLWWAGLPPSVRGRVWSLTIGNELNVTAELYHIFLSRAQEKWSASQSQAGGDSGLALIAQDISRTFSSLCVFQKGGPYHSLLQSILGAYVCFRPDVGYVQGMSSVAAVLLLNTEEVAAFVGFSNLINRPCQLAFYRGDHQLMLGYFQAFQVFLEELLPRLFLHFQSLGLTPDLYLIDWILTLYSKPLPLDVACRVWDVFFRDGEEFLFRTALGILRLHRDVLLHMDLVGIATPMLSRNRTWNQVLTSCRAKRSVS
ncbi:TBC1 domain family member 12-like isoform X3 [Antennarius striatus]|uniref:TBC1 domain family member 12-like isoform X3 n=1 Tax=Antennarius striatus TaxID=241820 RepID=UPI0035B237D3